MIRRPPRSTRTDTLFPDTTLFRSRKLSSSDPEQIAMIKGLVAGAVNLLIGLLRSEEHTSELQSLMRISYAVFCLKNTMTNKQYITTHIFYPNHAATHQLLCQRPIQTLTTVQTNKPYGFTLTA